MASSDFETTSAQKFWNFVATLVFIFCCVLVGIVLKKNGLKLEDISVWEVILLSLATYRLTRILVFDKIFKFFRDFIKSRSRLLVFHVVKEIITCPWCAGVWMALLILCLYYLVPYGNIFIYLFAISGIASMIVVSVNYIGLSTEEKQQKVKDLKQDSDYTKP